MMYVSYPALDANVRIKKLLPIDTFVCLSGAYL